jgi:hypothetical protein
MYRALVKLHYMLEHPKALSTIYIISKNLKDITMGNQQETKVLYFNDLIHRITIPSLPYSIAALHACLMSKAKAGKEVCEEIRRIVSFYYSI